MDSKIRIIVADDHAVVREGIRIWLERDPRVEVVATADDTESLADRIDSFPCDVVISDIGMRGINGENNAIAFLRRFLRQPQRPRVIIVTMIAQPQMLAGLLDLGVDGLVDKRDCMDALNQAVIEVIDGGRFVSTHAGALLGNEMVNVTGRAGVLKRPRVGGFTVVRERLVADQHCAASGAQRENHWYAKAQRDA